MNEHIKPLASDVEHAIESSDVRRAWHQLAVDVEALMGKLGEVRDVEVTRLREKASASLKTAREAAERSSAQASALARRGAARADNYVREQPWTAVGAIAVAGLVLGALLGSRDRGT